MHRGLDAEGAREAESLRPRAAFPIDSPAKRAMIAAEAAALATDPSARKGRDYDGTSRTTRRDVAPPLDAGLSQPL